MKTRFCTALGGASCLCLVVFMGCGGVAPATGQSSDQVVQPEKAAPEAMVEGAITVNGRVYVPLTDNAVAPWGSKQLSEMTIDELAEAMTARLGRYDGNGGYTMYRAIKPDYALARSIRDDESLPGGAPTRAAPGHIIDPSVGENAQYLLNSINPGTPSTYDPRIEPNNPFAYPYSTIVYDLGPGTRSCTGTYIGPNQDTLLTAAHCVRSSDVSNPPSSFNPADQNGYTPYGTFYGCYNWWYPTAWDTTRSGGCAATPQTFACQQYDYSVIDFRPCGNPTIALTGTMGFTENSGSSQWASGVYHYGYPGFFNLSGNPPDTVTPGSTFPCANVNPYGWFPFLCGAEGVPSQTVKFSLYNGSSLGSGPDFVANAVTSSQGESGGPWYYISGTTPYEVAVEVADVSLGTIGNQYNLGRFIDTTVWNFIFANANP
jgi:V8-like Glu-specific endopeptidase